MDTFLLGVLVEYPYIINRTNNTKRRKICTIMNIAKQRTVPVTAPVNVQKNNNVIVNKSFIRNFVMNPIIWFIVIVILMILAW